MLSVLLELQRLKRLDRTGWVLRGLPPGAESVAAHSYGVALTAMLLADECAARGVEGDVGRLLRIALLHDLPGAESVAAHSYGVALTAMLLADECAARGVEVDAGRVLRIALLHDLQETRTGDMPRTVADYYGKEARRAAERAAFDDIMRGATNASAYAELHEDYESRASLEARLVKAADVIDLLAQALAFKRAGSRGLEEFWE